MKRRRLSGKYEVGSLCWVVANTILAGINHFNSHLLNDRGLQRSSGKK